MARVFVSHSAHQQAERDLLESLVAALKAAGHDVLVDFERLKPNQDWRQEIHTWMALCHAAVALLSPAALASSWVLKEATVLTWRRSLDPTFAFVPILVPPANRKALEESETFRPLSVPSIQFAPIEPTFATVVDLLRAVDPKTATPMDVWVDRLANRLRRVESEDPQAIASAAAAAGADLPWSPNLSTSDLLARRLLHAPRTNLEDAVDRIAQRVGPENTELADIIEVVVPLWVDPFAVANVPEVAARDAPPRAIVIRAREDDIGHDFVNRAGCGDNNWRAIATSVARAESDQVNVDQVVADIASQGKARLRLPASMTLIEAARRWASRGRRYFALIPDGNSYSRDQISELQTRLDPLTLVFLIGDTEPSEALRTSDAVVLRPELTPAAIAEGRDRAAFLRSMTAPIT